jgi:dephospho-CoA kinase
MQVGLTGGVGSGKSTVSARLAALGAVVIDADAIAREVVEPGTAGLAAVVERFGAGVLDADGRLDRPAVAAIVFNDDAARADLNAIVHPLVGQRTTELMAAAAPDAIVVYDVPLLVESNMAAGFEVVIVVEAQAELRIARLEQRGMAEADARARMAIQATDEQRRAVADEIVENNASRAELEAAVDALWARLVARQAAANTG